MNYTETRTIKNADRQAENDPIPSTELEAMRKTAEAAAFKAGKILKDYFGRKDLKVIENQQRDIKIEVDLFCETAIYDIILEKYPQHCIVSEEKGHKMTDSRYVWIIDPLDGTINFYSGIPLFCTCIACYLMPDKMPLPSSNGDFNFFKQATALVGVVNAPLIDRLFSAAAGSGAMLNGNKIHPPRNIRLEDAVVGASFGSNENVMRSMEAVNASLIRRVKKIRIFGATGLDLAHVATGHLSGLTQFKVRIWDIAAALVILQESGGMADVKPGLDGGWKFIAANPSIFAPFKKIIDDCNEPV